MQQLIHEANVNARTGANGVVAGAGKKVGITARDVRKVSQVSFFAAAAAAAPGAGTDDG